MEQREQSLLYISRVTTELDESQMSASSYQSHPTPLIRQRLRNLDIKLLTTKEGDVIAQTVDKYNFRVSNYVGNNETRESVMTLKNKTWYLGDQEP